MPSYIHLRTASGAETVTDQLTGTAVAVAGTSGRVKAAVVSTLTTTRVTLTGRKSGKTIIPNSFTPVTGALTALDLNANHFIFEGVVEPREELELQIVPARGRVDPCRGHYLLVAWLVTRAGRGPGLYVMYWSGSDINGDQAFNEALEPGFGDALILEALYRVTAIDVISATAVPPPGVELQVVNAASSNWDIIGASPFYTIANTANALAVSAHIRPEQPVLITETERIRVTHLELDTDATPTADYLLAVKLRRLGA